TDPPRILRRFTGPVMGRNGQPIARLWTFLDITEMKRLQAEVQAQLSARTADFEATQSVLLAMNDLCRLSMEHQSTEELQTAISSRVASLVGPENRDLLFRRAGPDLSALQQELGPYQAAHLTAVADQVALTLETHRLQSELQAAMQTL